MKEDISHLEKFRNPDPEFGGDAGAIDGMYRIPFQGDQKVLQVIASELHEFDRVSVVAFDIREHFSKGHRDREPTMKELRFIRRLFFEPEEPVVINLDPDGNPQSKTVQMFRAQEVPMPEFG